MKTIVHTDRREIDEFIASCDICYVGMADTDGTPYVLPMNFGYENGVVYLHSGAEGRKMEILERNPRVCITFCAGGKLVWQHPDVACSYSISSRSVVAWGTVAFEDDFDRKVDILRIFMKHHSGREFKFNAPAVMNVKVWKVAVDSVSMKVKEFGVSSKGQRPTDNGK
ncbi:MAG: pyridoxamine 5'-phosphate oxidase family protein [Tannerellaceae bacterium]|jgi:nitroimidazol reductase NimA-like FMN-containing flavoprotein (pyridoxamine 5'-phosphate oxidase superfamily)|nr:pyridoxamine 5'-phosphate oxidase family protein [Tannerellaceae bacterium]